MTRCAACHVPTTRRLCYFCTRTVALIQARRCVSCLAPVNDDDSIRVQGKCGECLERGSALGVGTRWVLHQATRARATFAIRRDAA